MSKSGLKIWVVDDDVIYKYIIDKLFGRDSIPVEIKYFEHGDEALMAFEAFKGDDLPDWLLLDIMMPECDGFEFLEGFEKIRNGLDKKPQILVISSSLNPTDEERSLSYNFVDGFLNKPVTTDQLKGYLLAS